MTRAVPPCCVAFVKLREDFRPVAYPDPATRGPPWTIAYGHTGPDVHEGQVVTLVEGEALLSADLALAASRLAADVHTPELSALTDHQYATLVSFVYNVGASPGWSIWSVLDAGDLASVPSHMLQFDKAHVGGVLKVVPGLLNRREAEVALWGTPD